MIRLKSLYKDIFKEIWHTKNRFLSIFAIIALGTGFFAGVKVTCPDMKLTAEKYYQDTALMDVSILSTAGFSDGDVQAVRGFSGIQAVQPGYSVDVLVNEQQENQAVIKILSYDAADNQINKPVLKKGRFPEASGECVVENGKFVPKNFKIGETITITSGKPDADISETLKTDQFQVVGVVESSQYISTERGSSSIGDGTISGFMMVNADDFGLSVYTDLFAVLQDTQGISPFDSRYQEIVDEKKQGLEELANERTPIRYQEMIGDAQNQLQEAKTKLADARQTQSEELAKAEEQLNSGKVQLESSRTEYQKKKDEFSSMTAQTQRQLDEGRQTLKASRRELEQKEIEFDSTTRQTQQQLDSAAGQIATARQELSGQQEEFDRFCAQTQAQLDAEYAQIQQQEDDLAAAGKLDEQAKQMLAAARAELDAQTDVFIQQKQAAQGQIDGGTAKLEASEQELARNQSEFERQTTAARQKLEEARRQLEAGEAELDAQANTFAAGKQTAQKQLEEGAKQLSEAERKLAQGQSEYDTQKAQSDQKLADAQDEINTNEEKLREVAQPQWYVMDRSSNPGYSNYGTDAERVDAVAKVFPIFFILVAVLVCLTTMTRMVEEQRTQIGTLKALGYSKSRIILKYMIYAILASVLGSAAGLLVCMKLFPIVIVNAYRVMYTIPVLSAPYRLDYAFWSTLVAILCTTLSALAACYAELVSQPAKLMRPKSPKIGKRILLERIGFIWSRMNFIHKVTARNIFRYKRRVLMTVVGIAGCTALMLTGFGLQNSISSIVVRQYEDLFIYDAVAMQQNDLTQEQKDTLRQELDGNSNISQILYTMQKNMSASNGKDSWEASVFVPEEVSDLSEYIVLKDRVTQEPISLSDSGVVVSEKLAKLLKLSVGSDLTLTKDTGQKVTVMVSGITENYTMHFVYMTPVLYRQVFAEDPDYNSMVMNVIEDHNQQALATEMAGNDKLLGVYYSHESSANFNDMVGSLTYIVLIIIVSAGALAFVVLYNLVNINVNERIRELATIKVLGFYDKEVSAYVYRENMVCTVMGIALGLFAGVFLERFVVETAEIDIVMFAPDINIMSFVYAGALTLLFTGIVNFVLHFKLKKINMVESLKSIE